jgi:methylphosphotriester-DNA--protein-cysteine methyltransferase
MAARAKKMTRAKLEKYVKERFGKRLDEFIKQKVEGDTLHDHEIAHILNVDKSRICKLRREYGIKRANGFLRRFERTYGAGAVQTFKKMIESPETSLTDVGRHFGFTREYARHVYRKICGRPYGEAYQRKRLQQHKKRLAEKRNKSKRVGALMRVGEKMRSLGLPCNTAIKGNSYTILINGYKLGLRISCKPTMIGRKAYYRFNKPARSHEHIDFFVCICRRGSKDIHFIIPSNVMPKALISLLPEATPDQSKYAQFREAWHLLDHKISKEAPQIH